MTSAVTRRADAAAESPDRVNHITREIRIVGLVRALLLGSEKGDQLLGGLLSPFAIDCG